MSSGTAALHLALLLHGIGPGDEVIVPAFSFAATANTVLHAGARPVFVDVREDDFGIDVAQLEAAITPRTRAVVAVHLYGQPCDIEAVAAICARRGLALVEDAAQAVGASAGGRRAGTFGTGAFSFYATKNLQTGEGGMITTDDDALAERARLLRSQGERTRYVTEEAGYNYRMTEIAAALGHAQLPKLDARNAMRRANAARLTRAARPAPVSSRRASCRAGEHVWHQYTVRVRAGREARDRAAGVAARAGHRVGGLLSGADPPAAALPAPRIRRRAPAGRGAACRRSAVAAGAPRAVRGRRGGGGGGGA